MEVPTNPDQLTVWAWTIGVIFTIVSVLWSGVALGRKFQQRESKNNQTLEKLSKGQDEILELQKTLIQETTKVVTELGKVGMHVERMAASNEQLAQSNKSRDEMFVEIMKGSKREV